MGAGNPEMLDERIEAMLRASRPEPKPDFVPALRERLFPQRPARRPRPVLLGGLATATAAAAVLLLSLAGVGPLAAGGGRDQDVKARSTCRFVLVTEPTRVPVIVHSGDGKPRVVYRERPVERRVKRCG
jgi:hypothetical protein